MLSYTNSRLTWLVYCLFLFQKLDGILAVPPKDDLKRNHEVMHKNDSLLKGESKAKQGTTVPKSPFEKHLYVEKRLNHAISLAMEKRKAIDKRIAVRLRHSRYIPFGMKNRENRIKLFDDYNDQIETAKNQKKISIYLHKQNSEISDIFNEQALKNLDKFKNTKSDYDRQSVHAWDPKLYHTHLAEELKHREEDNHLKDEILSPIYKIGEKYKHYFQQRFEHQVKNKQEEKNPITLHPPPYGKCRKSRIKEKCEYNEFEQKREKIDDLLNLPQEIRNPPLHRDLKA